ncbi:diaminobutyrate acetyltransferase [Nocardiopsis halophila]|uniref:diaminobutyrate acetyltransferase n=1 Tax=Nocardiopsis halophila TaxID=141692 RepID=UPI000347C2FD|nr:diaminobutyrate acetyltransferase [Nocardiopsis halophila]
MTEQATGRTAEGGPDDGLRMSAPEPADGPELWRLARDCGLDLNSPYAYTLWCRDFARTTVIAREADGRAVGFVTGFMRPDDRGTYFLWQVGVHPRMQGRRLARRMLDHLAERFGSLEASYLEATVTPDNAASRALFGSFARARGVEAVWTPLFTAAHFPEPGEAGAGDEHEPEDLVRIGPLVRPPAGR